VRQTKRQYKQEVCSRTEETEISIDTKLEWDGIKNITNYTDNQVLGIETNGRNSN
jgi:hypothetical protein